jgi:hypothetical protein
LWLLLYRGRGRYGDGGLTRRGLDGLCRLHARACNRDTRSGDDADDNGASTRADEKVASGR